MERKGSATSKQNDSSPNDQGEVANNEQTAGCKQNQNSDKKEQEYVLPQIDFATFIFSLNSSALLNLGFLEDPVTGKKEKNLALAKQSIDILGMLEEKTKGNLEEDERNMLKNILYELRLKYVQEDR